MNALRTLLGLVVLLVVGLVVPEVASAKPVIGAETRVGAFNPDGQVRAGVEADAGARVHRGFADAKYDFTAGSPHAAGAGGNAASRILHRTPRNLQKFFTKHGDDFGLTGNWNPSRAADASRAIHQHINSAGVRQISGTYRGNPVTHHLDPKTGLNVIEDAAGNFVSGWKLGGEQLQGVLSSGRLF